MSDHPTGSEPRRLSELEEARDVLLTVFLRDGFAIAGFKFGAVAFPEELEPKLREMIGREVACLRLDGKYHVREVS
ncbi:MAG: hypothetical protein WCP70_04300 [Methanothrix sp.]